MPMWQSYPTAVALQKKDPKPAPDSKISALARSDQVARTESPPLTAGPLAGGEAAGEGSKQAPARPQAGGRKAAGGQPQDCRHRRVSSGQPQGCVRKVAGRRPLAGGCKAAGGRPQGRGQTPNLALRKISARVRSDQVARTDAPPSANLVWHMM